MARVFVSYTEKADGGRAREILGWLREDGHEPFLAADRGHGMRPGDAWRDRIAQELRAADAVVFVVTRAFNASIWCNAEVGMAVLLGCRLLPLRVEAGVSSPLLDEVHYIECHDDPVSARHALDGELRAMGGGYTGWRGSNPYPGLHPFSTEHARTYFGRDVEIRDALRLLRAPTGSTPSLLAIAGPSGCGKSSLLRAGLVPALHAESAWVLTRAWQPLDDPLDGLAHTLVAAARQLGVDWSLARVRSELDEPDDLGLRRLAAELLLTRPEIWHRHLVLALDQAEELFTRAAAERRSRLARLIAGALAGPVRLMVTIRSEFLDDLRDMTELADVTIHPFLLGPLSPAMLRLAIEEPARLAGLTFERGLVSTMVAETETGEALPLLAFTLRQLAEGRARGTTIPAARYRDLGGVSGALVGGAELALATAASASGLTARQILVCLLRLVTLDESGRRSRRRLRRAEFSDSEQKALDTFLERRLLTGDASDDGDRWITPTHEALLTQWASLDLLIIEWSTALSRTRAIERAAAEWHAADRAETYLWGQPRVDATMVEVLGPGTPVSEHPSEPPAPRLDSLAEEFVAACRDRARRTAEQQARAGRRLRRLRISSAGVLAATLVALLVAAIAIDQERAATSARRTAVAHHMVTEADALRTRDPEGALSFAVAAMALKDDDVARASLINTLTASRYTGGLSGIYAGIEGASVLAPSGRVLAASRHGEISLRRLVDGASGKPSPLWRIPGTVYLNAMAFSSDDALLASADQQGTVRMWEVTGSGPPRPLLSGSCGGGAPANAIAVSSHPGLLAAGCGDATVVLLTPGGPATGVRLGTRQPSGGGAVRAMAISADATVLVSADGSGRISGWNVADPAHPVPTASLASPVGAVSALVLAADRTTVVLAGERGTAVLTGLGTNGRPPSVHLLPRPFGTIPKALALTVDARTLAVGNDEGTIEMWDVAKPDRPHLLASLRPSARAVTTMTFTSSGDRLLTTDPLSGVVTTWRVADPGEVVERSPRLAVNTNSVYALEFAPGNTVLGVGSDDETIAAWDLGNSAQPRILGGGRQRSPGGRVRSIAFAPGGGLLATGNENGRIMLWELRPHQAPRLLGRPPEVHQNFVDDVAFSPDGTILASASDDNTVRLWDVRNPARPTLLAVRTEPHAQVRAVAFSATGHMLFAASNDGTILEWRLPASRERHPVLIRKLSIGGQADGGSADLLNSVAFSPNGEFVAAGYPTGEVAVFDLRRPGNPHRVVLTDLGGSIQSVRLSGSAGGILAAGNDKGLVALWDLTDPATPRPLSSPLPGPSGSVVGLAFSPDGRTLVAGGDREVARFDLTALQRLRADPLPVACARGAHGPDQGTWAFYASGINQPPVCAGKPH
ncbi:putative WD-40 repeat-containing protein [Frankia canadensis]|uniref:Putative WD-40 repeat-containing protein n=1 Tax=Frankia canadensis TaxID=1836972 RepID=A0A2I2KWX6_9ACTN|nr:TIR domain-containing protein [Frankia canadensis]SNQ50152.1 putative WD-40 repeat-containing protein [Frankia canadensis]SOU57442.1 putative WD-40 repeat-containing protein [Frankia canadensis]